MNLDSMKILAIGAHPDDVEFGCSGLLQRASLRKILVLSRGAKGASPSRREQEARRAAGILNAQVEILDFVDTDFHLPELIPAIEARVRDSGCDVVLTMSEFDTHQDHRNTSLASVIAVREINCTILSYMTPSNSDGFRPNWFVPMTKQQLEVKLRALRCHRTQSKKSYLSKDFIVGMARYWAMMSKCGAPFVEPFALLKHVDAPHQSRLSGAPKRGAARPKITL